MIGSSDLEGNGCLKKGCSSLFERTQNLSDFIKSNNTNEEPEITDLFIL